VSHSNEQAAVASEARILAQQAQYRQQLTSFMKIMGGDAPAEEKLDRFHELLGHSADFANICEQSIGDASLLGATKNEAWARNKAETSLDALDTILQMHKTLVAVAEHLNVPPEVIRPSPMAYASLQRHVALFFPERVEMLRALYEEACLPVVGFDDVISQNARGEFFHVLAGFDAGAPAIANDLTREALMTSIVTPLLSGKAIRVDGHLIEPDHPRLKISRTEHNCAHYGRELELGQKRNGIVDFSINRRQLPLDQGTDVTREFLASLKPKKRNKTSSEDLVARTHNTIVWLVFFLGLAATGAGVVAVVFRATGSTTLNLVGVGLDTSSVAVACIAIGLLIAWLAIRSVLRSMKDLAQIRANVAARTSRRMDGGSGTL
jgi:hypothetical protein